MELFPLQRGKIVSVLYKSNGKDKSFEQSFPIICRYFALYGSKYANTCVFVNCLFPRYYQIYINLLVYMKFHDMLTKRLTMIIKRFVQPTNIILNLENCQSTNVSKYIGSYK